jgi:hypothetical protein
MSTVRRSCAALGRVGVTAIVVALVGLAGARPAWAAQSPVTLGTATTFAVLAGTTVTNTGPTRVSGNLGLHPGSAVTGFPPGVITNGSRHVASAFALQAKSALTAAYNNAAGRTPATVVGASQLAGKTLAPGVYKAAPVLLLSGTVTLDGRNNPNAVFIFQAGSSLVTASNSRVRLVRGAQACNVFWQVSSSATLGTGTAFAGSILALTSISVQTGATVNGRVLARNGQVSLDSNVITRPSCAAGTRVPRGNTLIPRGNPNTGAGGASGPEGAMGAMGTVGSVAIMGAVAAMWRAIRRRRAVLAARGAGQAQTGRP